MAQRRSLPGKISGSSYRPLHPRLTLSVSVAGRRSSTTRNPARPICCRLFARLSRPARILRHVRSAGSFGFRGSYSDLSILRFIRFAYRFTLGKSSSGSILLERDRRIRRCTVLTDGINHSPESHELCKAPPLPGSARFACDAPSGSE